MYPVSANFHTLAIQDAPKTRVRIYFIGDAVDCTDDADVVANGTLLIGEAGDTDSNKRIGQNGITFNEMFNSEKNVQIGDAVSSQIGMTLLNTDGALDNFQYGRCKVYLDVYDTANTAWLSCPMGVYIIELPTKRKVQLVNAVGFDQMTKFDEICDTWWNGLNWSGGLTLLQIVQSMATQLGVSVSSNTASAIVNSSLSYTESPFDCVQVTYREVLEYVAEATGTVARFDRDGALDLRWFNAAQIGGNTITINTDTVGNQCLSIDKAEYSVAQIDLLRAKFAKGDIGVTTGSGSNEYTIQNNLFLNGATTAAIQSKLADIYTRLNALSAYYPISGRFIFDWSIEAGDIILVRQLSTNYTVPIFQNTMTWRGGYVVSDLISDGDKTRPVLDATERDYYRLDSDMRTIIIDAPRINLLGYTTINNGFKVNLDGTFEANGATINGSVESVDQIYNNKVKITAGIIKLYDENGNERGNLVADQGVATAEFSGYGRTYVSPEGISLYDTGDNFRTGLVSANDGTHFWAKDANGNVVAQILDSGITTSGDISCEWLSANTAVDAKYVNILSQKASNTLTTAGWYRVVSCTTSGSLIGVSVGIAGAQIVGADVLIAELDTAQIVVKNVQKSNVISDIRVMRDSGNSYHIDIKKANSTSTTIVVDLDPHGHARTAANMTAASLTAVADSPAGETRLTTISLEKRTAPLSSPTSLITNGTIANSTTFSYTATESCWFYYVPVLQAGTSGGFEVKLNNVILASYTSGEAIGVNVAAIPVPMQKGDVLDITQNSNRTSSYRVLTMRGAS